MSTTLNDSTNDEGRQQRQESKSKQSPAPALTAADMQFIEGIYAESVRRLTAEGSLTPTLFLVAGPTVMVPDVEPGSILRIEFQMPDDHSLKDQIAQSLRETALQADAVLGVVVCEGWTQADRTETVIVSVDRPGDNWSIAVPIRRDSAGRPSIPPELPPFEHQPYDTAHGRLACLLGPATTTGGAASIRRVAYVQNATARELADAVRAADHPVVIMASDPPRTWECSITGVVANDQQDQTVVLMSQSNPNAAKDKPIAAVDLADTLQPYADARVTVTVDGQPYKLYSVIVGGGFTAIVLCGPHEATNLTMEEP